MKRIWFSLIAAGLLTIAAIAPVAGEEESITVSLSEVDGSGVEGQARIAQLDDQSSVEVLITTGLEDGAVYSVNIYEGTCDDLGDVAFELEDIVGGVSESEIDASLMDLMDGNHAVAVHAPNGGDETIACAEIEEAGVGGPGVDDADDAVADDDDVAVDDDDAVMDDEDDAVMDDDDAAYDDEDDAVAEEDDHADDVEDAVVPAAGSVGGPSGDTLALMFALMAGSALGVGVLIRRKAGRAILRS